MSRVAPPAQRIAAHLPWAFLAGAALAAAAWIPLDRIPLRACATLRWTGIPCPFCGMTRAFRAAANGQWADAAAQSPLGLALYLGTWGLFLCHAAALAGLGRGIPARAADGSPGPRIRRRILFAGIGLLLANWAYRIIHGLT